MAPGRLLSRAAGALLGLAAAAAVSGAARAPASLPGDMALGRAAAPVTVVEYASLGCPHCARWATTVFPEFRRRYIDTGRVRFVLREMLTGDAPLAAAGFLTARCAGKNKYFQVVEQVYAQQQTIMFAPEGAAGPLRKIAADAGVPSEKFEACLKDEAALKALNARATTEAEAAGVSGTPTFLIGKKALSGEQSLASLGEAIVQARR